MQTKYIVFEDPTKEPYMFMFADTLEHMRVNAVFVTNTMWPFKAVSAGFVNTGTGDCYGESISMKLKSNTKRDTILAKRILGIPKDYA